MIQYCYIIQGKGGCDARGHEFSVCTEMQAW